MSEEYPPYGTPPTKNKPKVKTDKSKDEEEQPLALKAPEDLPLIKDYLSTYISQFNDINSLSEKWGKNLKNAGAVLASFATPTGVLSLLTLGMKKILDIQESVNAQMREYRGMVADLAVRFGAFGKQWNNVISLMRKNMSVFISLHNNMAAAAEFAGAFVESFNRLKTSDIEKYNKLILYMSRALGMGTAEAARFVYNMETMGMKSVEMYEMLNDVITVNEKNLRSLGIPTNLLFKSMQQNVNLFIRFGKEGKNAFITNVIWAKQFNVELAKITAISDTFEDLETGLKNVANLSIYFGTNLLSAVDLLITTDPAKRVEKIRDAVLATGKSFDTMTYYEKKALMTTLNLSEEEASRIFNIKEGYKSTAEIMKELERNKAREAARDRSTKQAMAEVITKLNKALKETGTLFRDLGPKLRALYFAAEKAFGPLYERLFGFKGDILDGITKFLNDLGKNQEWKKMLYFVADTIKMIGSSIKDLIILISDFFSKNPTLFKYGLLGSLAYGSLGLIPAPIKGVIGAGFGNIFKDIRILLKGQPGTSGGEIVQQATGTSILGKGGSFISRWALPAAVGTIGGIGLKKFFGIEGSTISDVAGSLIGSAALGVGGKVLGAKIGGVLGTALGPVGTAVGAAAGMAIAGILVDKLGPSKEERLKRFKEEDEYGYLKYVRGEKEKLIEAGKDTVRDILDAKAGLKEITKEKIKIAVEELKTKGELIKREIDLARKTGKISDEFKKYAGELVEGTKHSERFKEIMGKVTEGTSNTSKEFDELEGIINNAVEAKTKEIESVEKLTTFKQLELAVLTAESKLKQLESLDKIYKLQKERLEKDRPAYESWSKGVEGMQREVYIQQMKFARSGKEITEVDDLKDLSMAFMKDYDEMTDRAKRMHLDVIVKKFGLKDVGFFGKSGEEIANILSKRMLELHKSYKEEGKDFLSEAAKISKDIADETHRGMNWLKEREKNLSKMADELQNSQNKAIEINEQLLKLEELKAEVSMAQLQLTLAKTDEEKRVAQENLNKSIDRFNNYLNNISRNTSTIASNTS